jgi:hypothetical protein
MNFFRRAESGLFASASLGAHLARGAIAAALLAWAIPNQGAHPVASLAVGIAALIAVRGCPICWTVGLIETIAQRIAAARTEQI